MLKKAVQQGRSERRGEAYSFFTHPTPELLWQLLPGGYADRRKRVSRRDLASEKRDFFSILQDRKDCSMLDEVKNRVRSVERLVSELRGHL